MSSFDWIDREEYPFESHFFQVPGGNLHYVDEGSGSPIVMVHGNPSWSFLYRKLIRRFRSGYRCIAIDHLGFGLSDKPEGWSYLPEDHARNLALFIDKLGLKNITLAVQDWGGPIGLSYAIAHPGNVSRIIIMNTWAWPVHRDPYYIIFSGIMGGPIGRLLIRRYNVFARIIMRQTFGDKRKLSPAIHEQYLRALSSPGERKGCYVFAKQIVASTPWLDHLWSHISILNDIPKLIVWGMKDIAFREKELQRWERKFPEAHIVRLPSVGHFVQEEAPEELAAAVAPFMREPAQN